MATAHISFKVKDINLSGINQAAIVDAIAEKVIAAFDGKIGPHVADVAQARAPVSAERNFSKKRLQAVQPKRLETFEGSKADKALLQDIAGMSGQERAAYFKQAFKSGQTTNPAITKFFRGHGKNLKKTPIQLQLANNTIKGQFSTSGTLKKSIRYLGARRVGDRVIGTVRAHAPYAIYVHEGFTHEGGRTHEGAATNIKGRPYLKSALINVRKDLGAASTYEG